MPRLIKSNKTITTQLQDLDEVADRYFNYVPSAFKRDADLAYTVIYNEARKVFGNPKDIVKIAREIPEIWQPALSVVQARQNKDKLQAQRMLKLIRKGLDEILRYLKARDEKQRLANLQSEPEDDGNNHY